MDRQTWVEKRADKVDPRTHSGATSTLNPANNNDGPSIRAIDRNDRPRLLDADVSEDWFVKYKDWRWMHGVVPPAKMEISFILKRREEIVGDLSEHDFT